MTEINTYSSLHQERLNEVLDSIYTDLVALRTSLVSVVQKLDSDTGVEDTNYEATAGPAALTTSQD